MAETLQLTTVALPAARNGMTAGANLDYAGSAGPPLRSYTSQTVSRDGWDCCRLG